jgi:hypothetical protein
MDDDIDPREENRDRRRDRDAAAAARKPMDSGSAKRWHAIGEVVRRRGEAARKRFGRRGDGESRTSGDGATDSGA